MNSLQKQAWLTVIMAIISTMAFLAALPFLGPFCASGMFGLFGLSGLGSLFIHKDKWDERDRAINRRAALTAGWISYLTFYVCCFGSWFVLYQLNGIDHISVHWLAAITGIGGFVGFVAHAVAVLIFYHRPMEAGNA